MELAEFQATYTKIVQGIESELEKTGETLEIIAEEIKDTSIFEDVNKFSLSRLYGTAVDRYNGLCARLSRCSVILIMIRKLKLQIAKVNMPVSICNNCRAKLEGVEKNVVSIKDAVVPLKTAFEAQIKYFNSCQWMLTSDEYADKS